MANSTPIDELTIEIDAKAQNANNAIDSLCKKINILTTYISKVDVGKLNSLGNGIKRLGDSLQTMKSVDARSINSVVNKINSLSAIDTSKFATVSANLHQMANGIQSLGTVSANVASVGELAKNISKLGNKSVQTAITNIPQLATSLNGLMITLSNAPRVSQNVIQMTNALANLTAQGSKVGSASSSIVKGLNRASSSATRANKSFKGLASVFGRFYANCFLVIRGMKSLWGSIESTGDYIESFNYYTVSFGKIASKWDKNWENYGDENARNYSNSFVTTMNDTFKKLSGVEYNPETGLLSETGLKNLGYNLKDVTQYAAQLSSMMDSIGQSGETTLATTNAFVKLAGDLSSLYNIDYSSASSKLQSVLQGQSRAGYFFGWDTTVAALQATADKFNLSKPVSEMQQYEKQQLRILTILEQSRVAWGDQSNTINTFSNQLRTLKNNITEFGNILGQLFIPILSKVIPVINGLVIAMKRLFSSFASILGLEIKDMGQGYDDMSQGMDGISDSLDGVAESAEKAKKGIRGFDELNVINTSSDSGNGSSDIGDNIDLTQQILSATAEYEKAWKEAYDRMQNRAEEFADKITKALEPVKKIFEDFAVGDFFQTGKDVSNLVVSITDFFARAIDNVDWYGIGRKIGDFLAGIDWIDILSSVGNLIWQGINAGIEQWKGLFDAAPIETATITAIAALSFTGLGKVLTGKIKESLVSAMASALVFGEGETAITGLAAVSSNISAAFGGASLGAIAAVAAAVMAVVAGLGYVFVKNEEVRQSFANATQAIKEGFQPAVEFITNTLLPNLQAGWERLKEILSPFTDFLNDAFASIWQDMINPALTYIGETVLPLLASAFENLWNKVLVPLGNFLADVLEPVIQIVSDVLKMLWENVVVPLADALRNILGKAFEGLIENFNHVIDNIQPLIQVMQFLWDKVLSPIVIFLWDTLKPTFETVFKSIKGIIDGLSKSFGGLIDFIAGVFSSNWKNAWNGVKDVFGGIFNGLISIVERTLNIIITGINKFLGTFDGVVTSLGEVIGIDISISEIPEVKLPKFEKGGLTLRHTYAEIGEYNKPEAILPLSDKRAMGMIADSIVDNSNYGFGENTTNIKDAIYSATYNAIKDAIKSNESNSDGNIYLQIDLDGDAAYKNVIKRTQQAKNRNANGRLVLASELY